MNWKATTAVSGATLLAGWLASAPPTTPAHTAVPSSAQSPQTTVAASDIAQLATRLQTQTRLASDYGTPERNLFRFGPHTPVRPAASERTITAAAVSPPEYVPQAPPPPPLSLSGVASDPDGQRTVRTAILSSPMGVLLVHQGDDVLGQYRVGAIGEDSVELTRLSDGTALRITLKP